MVFGMKIGAVFNDKLKKGIAGRNQSSKIVKAKFSPDDKVIWMHAASLGEYEQGLPVLEKLKEKFPNHKILITFFSPSGYENVVKKKTIADAICYLPFDKKSRIKEFVSNFKTDIFFTVKYDFWYNLLEELHYRNAKIYVVSALFYENQIFFKSFGKWFVNQLRKNVSWFFHQTENSEKLAKKIGLQNSSTSGDTRFDRVRQNLTRENFVNSIEEFKQNKTTLIFGSSWEAEEKIAENLVKNHSEIKIIIAPHDLKRISHLQKLFPNSALYSQFLTSSIQHPASNILIIDSIGLLSKLYSYGDLAIVGGGFHSAGLHNILEAAVFGIPVFFGNYYRKNPEADDLLKANAGKSFDDEISAANYISKLLKNPELLKEMGKNAGNFIEKQPDSSEMIVENVLGDFQKT